MKNYAGHRLSPWLGHLMVSRQETARPLLTPGEVMQLPADEALVQVSGIAPIRAKKVRYYLDRALSSRVAPPPKKPSRLAHAVAPDWSSAPTAKGQEASPSCGNEEGGLRREPELEAPDAPHPLPEKLDAPADFDLDADDAVQAEQSRKFRAAARLAALDPDDGIPL